MTPLLAAAVAFLASCVTGLVAWLLGSRKADADADSVVVAAAERVVDMLDKHLTEMRAEIDSMRAHVITCEHDNAALRAQIETLRQENAGLRIRVEDLEADLRDRGHPPH